MNELMRGQGGGNGDVRCLRRWDPLRGWLHGRVAGRGAAAELSKGLSVLFTIQVCMVAAAPTLGPSCPLALMECLEGTQKNPVGDSAPG